MSRFYSKPLFPLNVFERREFDYEFDYANLIMMKYAMFLTNYLFSS